MRESERFGEFAREWRSRVVRGVCVCAALPVMMLTHATRLVSAVVAVVADSRFLGRGEEGVYCNCFFLSRNREKKSFKEKLNATQLRLTTRTGGY